MNRQYLECGVELKWFVGKAFREAKVGQKETSLCTPLRRTFNLSMPAVSPIDLAAKLSHPISYRRTPGPPSARQFALLRRPTDPNRKAMPKSRKLDRETHRK
jgi:hypothetical protein